MGDAGIWQAAERVALRELEKVTYQSAMTRKYLDSLNQQMLQLTEAVKLMQGLQRGADPNNPDRAHAEAIAAVASYAEREATTPAGSDRQDMSSLGGVLNEPLPIATGGVRLPAADSSVYRAGLVLREHLRPMAAGELLEVFRDRGWVDPSWSQPESTVRAALRRTPKWGWGCKVDRSHFVWPSVADRYSAIAEA